MYHCHHHHHTVTSPSKRMRDESGGWVTDNMRMDELAFAKYAQQLERDDFEADILRICCSIRQVVDARLDTIAKLRASAEYLDSVWLRCRVSKTMGTSTSIVGGGLTIAGGVLTTMTAGLAAPILIAGIATSSVGAATNIGTSLVEKILNSKQVRDMNAAFERDKDITGKLDSQLEKVKSYRESPHLETLLIFAQQLLNADHIVVTLLKGILLTNDDQNNNVTEEQETKHEEIVTPLSEEDNSASMFSPGDCTTVSPERLVTAGVATMATSAASSSLLSASKDGVKYSPMDAGVFVESGKVIGSNSFRVAGQVIIGISAAFIVWDAIDLGFAISDLVRKRGSSASKILREKANFLETALKSTVESYSIAMPD